MSFNKHIKEIHKVKRHLLYFATQMKDNTLVELINTNATNYINLFSEAFSVNKEIKEDMKYFADVRSLAKYNENLVNGWLIEDFYIYIFNLPIFKKHGFEVNIANHDSDRVIKKERTFIDSNPDFTVRYKDISFELEIQALFLNIDYFHIKENKAKKAINNNSFIYQMMLYRKETIYFFPFSILQGNLEENKNWGGKKAYKFYVKDIPSKRFIGKEDLVKNFVFTFYLFAFYKKYGKDRFIEISKECIGLERKDIIKKLYDSF